MNLIIRLYKSEVKHDGVFYTRESENWGLAGKCKEIGLFNDNDEIDFSNIINAAYNIAQEYCECKQFIIFMPEQANYDYVMFVLEMAEKLPLISNDARLTIKYPHRPTQIIRNVSNKA